MAKAKGLAQVYQLKISLREIEPSVWRRVRVRGCTIAALRRSIQTCFGWE